MILVETREILIISTSRDMVYFKELLGGKTERIRDKDKIQEESNAIIWILIFRKDFIENDNVALVLGKNIFFRQGFSPFIEIIQERQGNYVIYIEKITYRNGWINKEQLIKLRNELIKTDYGKYLIEINGEI